MNQPRFTDPRRWLPLWAALALHAQAQTNPALSNLPRVLTPQQAAAIDFPPINLPVPLNLQTAAWVRVDVPKRGAPRQAVKRGGTAAVYTSLPDRAAPLLPVPAVGDQLLKFQFTGDLTQSWATMQPNGVPHLNLIGFGEFKGEATAAWTATHTLGPGVSKELVLRFVVPPSIVRGMTEADGPALWRSRLRVDVLANGHPAWSTESLRLRTDDGSGFPLHVLQQFGDPLVFPTDDEDTGPGSDANDSGALLMDGPSQRSVVWLSLGRFDPGQKVNLQFIARASAHTVPISPGGNDNRCKPRPTPGEWFCSSADVSMTGGTDDDPRLYVLP